MANSSSVDLKETVIVRRIKKASEIHCNDENFLTAAYFHLKTILKYEDKGQQSGNSYVLSKFFIENLDIYPSNRFACQIDEKFDWGLQIKPSEMVAAEKPSASFRRKVFHQCLKVGDILDCLITAVSCRECKLKVLNKMGSVRLIHDLDIYVTLPLRDPETNLINNDLIRVAVLGIERDQLPVSVKVTDEDRILRGLLMGRKIGDIKLGKIKKSDLPAYLNSQNITYPSYTQYLNSCPEFGYLSNHESFIEGFGLDSKRTYTLFSNLNRICDEEPSGTKLLQDAKSKDADNFLHLAESELASENFEKAVDAASEVLIFDPKCIRAYEIRGLAWTKVKNSLCTSKAFEDYRSVLDLDPTNVTAKQYFSQLCHKAARKLKKVGKQEKAMQALEHAIELDSCNEEVAQFLNCLKIQLTEKEPKKLEEVQLSLLEQEKNKIVSKLKQLK